MFLFVTPVAPDAIHHHVKTYREDLKNMHYSAPELEGEISDILFINSYSNKPWYIYKNSVPYL